MFDSPLPISYYREIATLSQEHQLYIVQHINTKKIYLKKTMKIYNLAVYEQLFRCPVRGIPRLYAMYEHDGQLTIIEEYVSGDTLQEILTLVEKISEPDAISYTMQLCDILTCLHTQEPPIIHRDIKPSNIMLTEDGRIVLLDLNAAKPGNRVISGDSEAARQDRDSNLVHGTHQDRDTRLIGTEGFAAPEQFGFGQSTCQTDIYAVGKLLTALVGGKETEGQSGPAGRSYRSISPQLSAIIGKCLEMNPRDRYVSATALKAALKAVQSHIG